MPKGLEHPGALALHHPGSARLVRSFLHEGGDVLYLLVEEGQLILSRGLVRKLIYKVLLDVKYFLGNKCVFKSNINLGKYIYFLCYFHNI